MGMNKESLKTVFENDMPQRVRNIISKASLPDETQLKVNINNFLWMNLPMRTTLREAEMLASNIFDLIYSHNVGVLAK